jgi:hypothetical protein
VANFDDHFKQAENNLLFLQSINSNTPEFIDWQITTCYYVAVHLINAFIANKGNLHFNSHDKVKEAINPQSRFVNTRLDPDTYASFIALGNLSRRSRYLCHEKQIDNEKKHPCEDRHFAQALTHLDALLSFMKLIYAKDFPKTEIVFAFTKKPINLKFFHITIPIRPEDIITSDPIQSQKS